MKRAITIYLDDLLRARVAKYRQLNEIRFLSTTLIELILAEIAADKVARAAVEPPTP